MPHYRKHGKIQTPITDREFINGMEKGKFCQYRHRAFAVLLYYSAIRKAEALKSIREQYQLRNDRVIFDVGVRLKHGILTPPLHLPLEAPYMNELYNAVANTERGNRVFPYCLRTGYNIIDRAFGFYPHFFRLSRITNFYLDGYTTAQLHSWTGLTLKALDYYLGIVDITKMGEGLAPKPE